MPAHMQFSHSFYLKFYELNKFDLSGYAQLSYMSGVKNISFYLLAFILLEK